MLLTIRQGLVGSLFGIALWSSYLLLCGCGERTMLGGTEGVLKIGGETYSEIQVGIHQIEGSTVKTLGFGVTDEKGRFRLLKNGAVGKLYLHPGEYRVTVETIGPEIEIPPAYLEAERTPLNVKWTGQEEVLSLTVEAPKTEAAAE